MLSVQIGAVHQRYEGVFFSKFTLYALISEDETGIIRHSGGRGVLPIGPMIF